MKQAKLKIIFLVITIFICINIIGISALHNNVYGESVSGEILKRMVNVTFIGNLE